MYTHPDPALHVSSVHWSPSLHTVLVSSHTPVVALHVNWEHALLVGQVTLGVYTQVLLAHVSVVHKFVSLHNRAISASDFCLVPHPVAGIQTASRHMSAGVGQVTLVYTHPPEEQVSIVHRLLSSHNVAMSEADFATVLHPDPS